RPACDERGIADHAHLTVGKAGALILGLARSHRFEPGRLGIGDGGRVGVEKLIVCKPLHSLPVSSDHRRKALVFQGENFRFAAHSAPPSRYCRPSKQEITAREIGLSSKMCGAEIPSYARPLRVMTDKTQVGAIGPLSGAQRPALSPRAG